jgi:hypothetical protein
VDVTSTSPPTPTLEDQLASLIHDVNRRPSRAAPHTAHWARSDPDSGTMVSGELTSSERRAVDEIARLLEAGIQYEHLEDPEDAIFDLLAHLVAQPTSDGLSWFHTKFAKTPQRRLCFLPVKHLIVREPYALFGIELLPVDSVDIPEGRVFMDLEPPVGCVARVEVEGTSLDKMRDRARATARRALRLSRIGLREHNSLHDRQLRFSLGDSYMFDDGLDGWTAPLDSAYDLELDASLVNFMARQALFALAGAPSNDLQKDVERAAKWLEKAMFEDDETVAVLFAFSALESLLGEELRRAKGAPIAFRLMMLSHLADGKFLEPLPPAFLYKLVRNDTIHGDDSAEARPDDLSHLLLVVRFAIRQSLLLADRHGFSTRAQLCAYIEQHVDRPTLLQWLIDYYGEPTQDSPLKNLITYARRTP